MLVDIFFFLLLVDSCGFLAILLIGGGCGYTLGDSSRKISYRRY